MARVVIVIEDLPDGKFRIKSDPSMETLSKVLDGKKAVTPAEGHAYFMLNTLWKQVKSGDSLRLLLPKLIGR